MKTTTLVILIFISFIACRYTDKYSSGELGLIDRAEMAPAADEATAVQADPSEPVPQPELKIPDKIIKEAEIKFEVDDYKIAKKKVDSLVTRWCAYIAKEDERYFNDQIENTIIIRVLSSNFEKLLDAIGSTSKKIDFKSVNSIDVTEEYIDIDSRLKTKREVENRYYEILKRAATIEDILRVENEIGKIREEIDAKEGRLKYLDDRISYSTITLTIYQQLEYKYRPHKATNFFTRLYKALDTGWKGLLSFIIVLFHIWPVIIVVIIGLIIFSRFRKRKHQNKTSKK